MNRLSGGGKCRCTAGVTRASWTVSLDGVGTHLRCLQSGVAEADVGVATDTDVALLAVDGEAHDPRSSSAGLDDQCEPVPVGVLSRRCVLGCLGSEALGASHEFPFLVPFS